MAAPGVLAPGVIGQRDGVDDHLPSATSECPTGRRMGRYRVGELIHDGPMSTVYRATDVHLDRPVALKLLRPGLAPDEDFRALFRTEARHTATVEHPHVVTVYDFDQDSDGQDYLGLRYIPGISLADLIASHPLPLTRVIVLADQIASALEAVHAHGLLHLDVKPANILITTTGPATGEYVYLVDFGLARAEGAAPAAPARQFLGSPFFAAPENLRGGPISRAADLYSRPAPQRPHRRRPPRRDHDARPGAPRPDHSRGRLRRGGARAAHREHGRRPARIAGPLNWAATRRLPVSAVPADRSRRRAAGRRGRGTRCGWPWGGTRGAGRRRAPGWTGRRRARA